MWLFYVIYVYFGMIFSYVFENKRERCYGIFLIFLSYERNYL